MDSPVGNNPPSIRHTCSQLIKAGLKLTIEQKRKQNQGDADDYLDLDSAKRMKMTAECSESEEDKIKQEPSGVSVLFLYHVTSLSDSTVNYYEYNDLPLVSSGRWNKIQTIYYAKQVSEF